MAIEPRKPWFRIWMVALILIAAGVAMIVKVPTHPLAAAFGDAVLIAGILALGVDPLLKRDLLREASRGIFIHLLGFEHHPQVKDKLKQLIFETKLIRTQLRNVLTIEPREDGAFMVTVEYESEIINPTATPVKFQPYGEWDMGHKPKVERMAFTSSDGKVAWTEKDVKLTELEPGVQTAKPHKVEIQPDSKGISYRGSGRYQILCKHAYMFQYMGLPTLNASFRVNAPEEYEVTATKADIETDRYWEYTTIKMVGDHITIRWRKRGGEWL